MTDPTSIIGIVKELQEAEKDLAKNWSDLGTSDPCVHIPTKPDGADLQMRDGNQSVYQDCYDTGGHEAGCECLSECYEEQRRYLDFICKSRNNFPAIAQALLATDEQLRIAEEALKEININTSCDDIRSCRDVATQALNRIHSLHP